jgi:hypothetical protein
MHFGMMIQSFLLSYSAELQYQFVFTLYMFSVSPCVNVCPRCIYQLTFSFSGGLLASLVLYITYKHFLHQPARWPSGLRRQLKVNPDTLVRKGVGSNPTLVTISFASLLLPI